LISSISLSFATPRFIITPLLLLTVTTAGLHYITIIDFSADLFSFIMPLFSLRLYRYVYAVEMLVSGLLAAGRFSIYYIIFAYWERDVFHYMPLLRFRYAFAMLFAIATPVRGGRQRQVGRE